MRKELVIVVFLTVTLSGCAVSKDPREGGLFGGLNGINSGEYDARIKQRQDDLNSHQEQSRELQEQSKQLYSEAQSKSSKLSLEQKRLAQMEEEMAVLEADTERLQAKSGVQQSDVATLKHKIEDHRKKLISYQTSVRDLDQAGGSTANPERYRSLIKERNRLEQEYKGLMKYQKALSDAAN